MKLELNKQYINRNGNITEPLVKSGQTTHSFRDPATGLTFHESGALLAGAFSDLDLVLEYVPPVDSIATGIANLESLVYDPDINVHVAINAALEHPDAMQRIVFSERISYIERDGNSYFVTTDKAKHWISPAGELFTRSKA